MTHLASLFTDHMVLQHGRSNPIWGWDGPNQVVTLRVEETQSSFAERTAASGTDGAFRIACPELPIGGPYRLRVRGSTDCVLDDVMVGEVWLASGQSNMQWTVDLSADAALEIPAAHWPQIRMFTVIQQAAAEPQTLAGGRWCPCTPENVGAFSAVGYYFARAIHRSLSVPVGIIHSSWRGTRVEAWTSIDALRGVMNVDLDLADRDRPGVDRTLPSRFAEPNAPAALFHGMIAPLQTFGLRGVIWYQGESNVDAHAAYRDRFVALIRDWRARWGEWEDRAASEPPPGAGPSPMPFYFVQLANFVESPAWPYLREAQAEALAEPATGMVVTIDIGDPDDIHPRNKQEVGRRLALLALAETYGLSDLEWSGPWLGRVEINRAEVRLEFRHAKGLRARGGGEIRGFALAGANRVYHAADAGIDGNAVVVTSPAVRAPLSVRYGWADNPEANLENAAGLPARPFRTDRY